MWNGTERPYTASPGSSAKSPRGSSSVALAITRPYAHDPTALGGSAGSALGRPSVRAGCCRNRCHTP
eukprot:9543833-Alexandrium_andersonii.AAC.1